MLLVAFAAGYASPTPTTRSVAGLTTEEYPISGKGQDRPAWDAAFMKTMAPIWQHRKAWREPTVKSLAERYNPVLSKAGCRLEPNGDRLDLYRGDQLLFAGIEVLNAIYPSADGRDFLLHAAKDAGPLVLTANGPLDQHIPEQQAILWRPVYAGDDLVHLQVEPESWAILVMKGDQVLYRYLHPRATLATAPSALVTGFKSWDGKWVLETSEAEVIVDGQSLNQQLDYDEIFNVHLLGGKPFFFFKRDGKIGLSYDGQALPQQYDQVFHYGCCDSTGWNPRSNDWMGSFFAQKENRWYYVEIGRYD